jgi:hypothetical protein
MGYYEVLMVIEKQHLDKVVNKITEYESEISGNLLLRIPMPMPYGHDDDAYARTYGEIVFEGQVYQFVKQKLYQDTLYVVCLKDYQTTQVRDAISDYSKSFAGKDQKSDNNQKGSVVSFAKFYTLWEITSEYNQTGWFRIIRYLPFLDHYYIHSCSSIFHPPCIA